MKHSRKRILLRASQWGWRGRCPALWTRRRRRGGRLAGADRKVTVSVRTVTVAILALPWTGRSPSGRHRTSTPAAALHVLLVFLRQHSGEVAEPRLEGCFPSSHFDYLNQVSPAQSDFRRFSSFFFVSFRTSFSDHYREWWWSPRVAPSYDSAAAETSSYIDGHSFHVPRNGWSHHGDNEPQWDLPTGPNDPPETRLLPDDQSGTCWSGLCRLSCQESCWFSRLSQ